MTKQKTFDEFEEFDELPEEFQFKKQTIKEIDEEVDKQLYSFSELLISLNVDEKLRILWTQIYKNAVMDRRNALIAWNDLYFQMHGKSEQHSVNGDRLAKYMERMEKANTQLLKLAELAQKLRTAFDEENDEEFKGDSLFDKLEKKSKIH